MIIDDILKVIYAPHKVFKSIVANPKYLGALIVLILIIGLQVGFEYVQFSKTYPEQTTPLIGQLDAYTNASSGNWRGSSGVALTNNYDDYFNYTVYYAGYGYIPYIFGNSSLQINSENTDNISAAIGNAFNVDCSPLGFQNLSMFIKLVQPQLAPQNATLTLYSLGDRDFYQYDLTPSLSGGSTIGQWNNLTIPLGTNATGWTSNGNPTWSNVTALKLDFTYPSASNVTINVGALFFRGHYVSFTEFDSSGVLASLLERFSLQFLLSWFLISVIIFLMLRLLKSVIVWKPVFIAIGISLFVMAIRAVINLIATLTLPAVYYPFDLSIGIGFNPYGLISYPSQIIGMSLAESQATFNNIAAATAIFGSINLATFVVAYVWLGGLCTIILGTLRPDFSLLKRIALSAIPIGITILVLIFLITGFA